MSFKHGFYQFTLIAALLVTTACSWVDGYSNTAHQQLLMLEQRHLQFISDAATAPVDQRLLRQEDRQIRQLFSLALNDGDALRQNNLRVLEKNYQRLYTHVSRQDAAMTPFTTGALAQQTEYLYQQAISGEQLRSGR
ncbi:hypothetical protein ACS6VN_002836 [Klebsiella oxytoca]|uniref:hypothetical protein n=1 Tax=Klebsiella oxytoca TaxID=571 RepID=UPI00191A1D0D|nr:hypothetical protein [Klebsiella oxytoca]CAA0349417.1 Uncharacterised protein [Klebsiella oxytoca]HBM9088276.1 hypothetical protein [Klebsiella oxytoca]